MFGLTDIAKLFATDLPFVEKIVDSLNLKRAEWMLASSPQISHNRIGTRILNMICKFPKCEYLKKWFETKISLFVACIIVAASIFPIQAFAQYSIEWQEGYNGELFINKHVSYYPDKLAYFQYKLKSGSSDFWRIQAVETDPDGNEKSTVRARTPILSPSADVVETIDDIKFVGNEHIENNNFQYGVWYVTQRRTNCSITYCYDILFRPNAENINKLVNNETVTSKFIAFETDISGNTVRSSKEVVVVIKFSEAKAQWSNNIETDDEGHAVVEIVSGTTYDDLIAPLRISKPTDSWFKLNSSSEWVDSVKKRDGDAGAVPDSMKSSLPDDFNKDASFVYGSGTHGASGRFTYGFWIFDGRKLLFRPINANLTALPLGTKVESVLGLNIVKGQNTLATSWFRVTLLKVDAVILTWLDNDNGSDIVANSDISTYRFGVMRSKPDGFATFDTSVSEVGANGNDTNNDDKLDRNTHMKGNFIDTEPMAGEEYEFATNFKYGKWYRRHIITVGSSSNLYCPATWQCVFFAFEPDADEIKKIPKGQSVIEKIKVDFHDEPLTGPKKSLGTKEISLTIASPHISSQKISVTWNTDTEFDDDENPVVTGTGSAATFPDIQGTMSADFNSTSNPSVNKWGFSWFQDSSPQTVDDVPPNDDQNSVLKWIHDDISYGVGEVTELEGVETKVVGSYGTWYIREADGYAGERHLAHSSTRQFLFRPNPSGITNGSSVKSYLRIQTGQCATSGNGDCSLNDPASVTIDDSVFIVATVNKTGVHLSWVDGESGSISDTGAVSYDSISGNSQILFPPMGNHTLDITARDSSMSMTDPANESTSSSEQGYSSEVDTKYGKWLWKSDNTGFRFDPKADVVNQLTDGEVETASLYIRFYKVGSSTYSDEANISVPIAGKSFTPMLTISGASRTVVDNGAEFTITSDNQPSNDLTVNVIPTNTTGSFLDSSFGSSGSTVAISDMSFSMVAGTSNYQAKLNVPLVGDPNSTEGMLTVALVADASTPQKYTLGSTVSHTVTILNECSSASGRVCVSIEGNPVYTADRDMSGFNVTASHPPAQDLEVAVTGTTNSSGMACNATIMAGSNTATKVCAIHATSPDIEFAVQESQNYIIGKPTVAYSHFVEAAKPGLTLTVDKNSVVAGESFTLTAAFTPQGQHSNIAFETEGGDWIDGTPPGSFQSTSAAGTAELTIQTKLRPGSDLDGKILFTASANPNWLLDDNLKHATVNVRNLSLSVASTHATLTASEGNTVMVKLIASNDPGEPVPVMFTPSNTTGTFLDVSSDPKYLASGTARTESLTFVLDSDSNYSAMLPVKLRDNNSQTDSQGTVTVSLNGFEDGANYAVNTTDRSSTITVNDFDVLALSISNPSSTVAEAGGATLTFDFTLPRPVDQDVSIAYEVSSDSTSESGDYTLGSESPLIISGGSDDTTVSLTITTVDDGIYEGDETLVLELTSTGVPFSAGGNAHVLTITITDDEEKPRLSIADSNLSVTKGKAATIRVKSSIQPVNVLSVGYTATNIRGDFLDTAASDPSPIDMTFKSEGSEFIGELTIGTSSSSTFDQSGEIRVVLNTPQPEDGYTIDNSANSVSVSVVDESDPVISMSAISASVIEGEEIGIVLKSTPVPATDIEVGLRVTQNGDNLAWPVRRTVRFNSGRGTVNLKLYTVDNPKTTDPGMVTVEVVDGDGYMAGNSVSVEVGKPTGGG